MAANIDVKPSVESAVTSGVNFRQSLAELKKICHKVINLEQNAQLRIQQGKESDVSKIGNYVRQGSVHYQGETGIIVAESPYLTNATMLREAIKENSEGRYFSTPNRKLYDKFFKQVQEDASKHPRERRAVFMPSEGRFTISQTQNPEVFEFLLGEFGQDYLNFVGQNSLDLFPISQETLKSYSGTVPIQLWFGRLGVYGSDLVGDGYGLNNKDGMVRGVRQLVSTEGANASQISRQAGSELYTPAQITEALEEMKLTGLEAQLMKKLRKR
ncbi:MAG: hypothetical protein AABW71_04865 [Nanoarchaeota archaeon]